MKGEMNGVGTRDSKNGDQDSLSDQGLNYLKFLHSFIGRRIVYYCRQ